MDIDNREVGKRIRFIRTNVLGLSMDDFGKKIDDKVKSGTVSNWETGKNLPNNQRLVKIAELGKTTVNELLHGNATKVNVMNDFIKYLEDEIKWRKESIIGFENAFVEGSRSEAIRYAKEYIERKLGGNTHD